MFWRSGHQKARDKRPLTDSLIHQTYCPLVGHRVFKRYLREGPMPEGPVVAEENEALKEAREHRQGFG